MIFTAYFDEADTHGRSPTVILAGHVGHAYQWRRFEKKLSRIQSSYGFRIFHAKDFKSKSREFRGWSDEKCAALIRDLANLVRDELTEGLTIFLERERYETEYRAPPIPNKMNLDSQLGVCFRGCMGRLLQIMEARGNRDTLHVVMEDGHPNVRDCERIFNDLKRRLAKSGGCVLGSFAVESKDACPPLMVADMLAATHSMTRDLAKKGEFNLSAIPSPAPNHRGGHLTFLELQENALTELKANFELLRKMEIDQWRQARDARRAGSTDRSS